MKPSDHLAIVERLSAMLQRAHVAAYVRQFTDAKGVTDHDAAGRFLRERPELRSFSAAYYAAIARELIAAGVTIGLPPAKGDDEQAPARKGRKAKAEGMFE